MDVELPERNDNPALTIGGEDTLPSSEGSVENQPEETTSSATDLAGHTTVEEASTGDPGAVAPEEPVEPTIAPEVNSEIADLAAEQPSEGIETQPTTSGAPEATAPPAMETQDETVVSNDDSSSIEQTTEPKAESPQSTNETLAEPKIVINDEPKKIDQSLSVAETTEDEQESAGELSSEERIIRSKILSLNVDRKAAEYITLSAATGDGQLDSYKDACAKLDQLRDSIENDESLGSEIREYQLARLIKVAGQFGIKLRPEAANSSEGESKKTNKSGFEYQPDEQPEGKQKDVLELATKIQENLHVEEAELGEQLEPAAARRKELLDIAKRLDQDLQRTASYKIAA